MDSIPFTAQVAIWTLAGFGALCLLSCLAKSLFFIFRLLHIYGCCCSESKERAKFQRYGSWAVVTGCTDGIGKEFALQLAAKKLNVVLLSRTQEKLNTLAQEIAATYQVETRIIAVDFRQTEIYNHIRNALNGLDIGILVNNVAMDYPCPMKFDQVEPNDVAQILNCNTLSLMMMSHIVLPIMLRKRCGLIVNVGSTGALAPLPFIAEYVATKAFLDSFSQSLALEYQPEGIDVHTLLPGLLATKLSALSNSNFFVKKPRDYVSSALRSIGHTLRCEGCVAHEIQAEFMTWFIPMLPFGIKRRLLTKEITKIAERKKAVLVKAGEQAPLKSSIKSND